MPKMLREGRRKGKKNNNNNIKKKSWKALGRWRKEKGRRKRRRERKGEWEAGEEGCSPSPGEREGGKPEERLRRRL